MGSHEYMTSHLQIQDSDSQAGFVPRKSGAVSDSLPSGHNNDVHGLLNIVTVLWTFGQHWVDIYQGHMLTLYGF